MFIDTEWAEAATISAMMTYAIAYGGFAQVIAGILEVSKNMAWCRTRFAQLPQPFRPTDVLRQEQSSKATAVECYAKGMCEVRMYPSTALVKPALEYAS